MGVTAENVAQKFGITREMQDALALESHRRVAKAIEAGYFKDPRFCRSRSRPKRATRCSIRTSTCA